MYVCGSARQRRSAEYIGTGFRTQSYRGYRCRNTATKTAHRYNIIIIIIRSSHKNIFRRYRGRDVVAGACRITLAAFISETVYRSQTLAAAALCRAATRFCRLGFFRQVPHRTKTALFRSTATTVEMDATVGHRPADTHQRHNTGDRLDDQQLVYGRQRQQDDGRQKEPLIVVDHNASCC